MHGTPHLVNTVFMGRKSSFFRRWLTFYPVRWALAGFWKVWFRTISFQVEGKIVWEKEPVIGFWHRDIAVVVYFLSRNAKKPLAALVSGSEDGKILAGVLDVLGIQTVFGSSSNGGSEALHYLKNKTGTVILITPDGPRGPAQRSKPGLLTLAKITGRPIQLIRVRFDRTYRFNSWDGFLWPKLFSSCRIEISVPMESGSAGRDVTLVDTFLNAETGPILEKQRA